MWVGLAMAVALGGGTLIYHQATGGGAPAGEAQLWVNTAASTCTRSSSPVSFATAQANGWLCTWNQAYAACQAGDTIRVKNGSYGDVEVTPNRPSIGGAGCQFIGESDTGVVLTMLSSRLLGGADYMNVKDITINTGSSHAKGLLMNETQHATYDNVDVTGPYAQFSAGWDRQTIDMTWKNSELGTAGNTTNRECGQELGQPVELDNVNGLTFDNMTFHPFIPDSGPECPPDNTMHLETIRINGNVDNFTIKNSVFTDGRGDNTALIFFTGDNSNGFQLVNSYLGALNGPGAGTTTMYLTVRADCTAMVFAYNHFQDGSIANDCTTSTGMLWVGNTRSANPGCDGTHIKNVWQGSGSCGTDTFIGASSFGYDGTGYHLTAGSPLINAGENTHCTTYAGNLDMDGGTRSGVCDAGPDEYGN
jgi:hypothetical protein